MAKVKVGDIVVRKSYNGDLYFKVLEIKGKTCKLKAWMCGYWLMLQLTI